MTNSQQEIDACEGKISLNLVRVWGDDKSDDENQLFRFPQDVKIGPNNLVYIVDSGNNRIQVFDRQGHFKRTIGRRGQGPGDLLSPMSIAFDSRDNIIIADYDNHRIQTFDPQGNSLSTFKTPVGLPGFAAVTKGNDIAVYCQSKSFQTRSILSLYSRDGRFIKDIGKHNDGAKTPLEHESLYIAPDKSGHWIVAFFAVPYYQVCSPGGDAFLTVTYSVPFKTPVIQRTGSKDQFKIEGKRKDRVASGLAVDDAGRVFLATSTRPPNKNEIFYLVSDGAGGMRRWPKEVETETTDRFRLLVFNATGKIIAAKKLTVFCEKLYIHDKSLFIIDTYQAMNIYEFTVNLN